MFGKGCVNKVNYIVLVGKVKTIFLFWKLPDVLFHFCARVLAAHVSKLDVLTQNLWKY